MALVEKRAVRPEPSLARLAKAYTEVLVATAIRAGAEQELVESIAEQLLMTIQEIAVPKP